MGELHDVYCFVTGATRRAIFRTKKTKDTPVEVVLDLELPEGLYVMMGSDFQKHFTHEFPKIHETAFKYVKPLFTSLKKKLSRFSTGPFARRFLPT